MSLCQSIDTLAMAFLDDELVAEERRELELHMLGCTSCKAHVDTERADLDLIRGALVAPPASDMLKQRITRALDQEDKAAARDTRRRLGKWLLPGSAMIAAAAAIAVFVAAKPNSNNNNKTTVAKDVIRQQGRALPLEVQGASTGPWLRQHFRQIEPPKFQEPGIQLVGARLTDVANHDAALLQYVVSIGQDRVKLTTVLIDDLRPDELQGGDPIRVGNRMMHIWDADGVPALTFVDDEHLGYVFTSDRLTPQELLQLVVTADLIGRAQRGQ